MCRLRFILLRRKPTRLETKINRKQVEIISLKGKSVQLHVVTAKGRSVTKLHRQVQVSTMEFKSLGTLNAMRIKLTHAPGTSKQC